MGYYKRKWEDVPHPEQESEEYLDSIPRFDAENMNRIEDGIEDLYNHGLGGITKAYSGDFFDVISKGGGFYLVHNATDAPNSAANWMNLIQISKEIDAGKETGIQIVPDVLSASDTDMWVRMILNGYAYNWEKLIHTGNISTNDIAQIEVLSYEGTGTYGKSNPNTVTFSRKPKMFMILDLSMDAKHYMIVPYGALTVAVYNTDVTTIPINFLYSGNEVSWYADMDNDNYGKATSAQKNIAGHKVYVIGLT